MDAQHAASVRNRLLVSLTPEASAADLCRQYNAEVGGEALLKPSRVSDLLNVWLLPYEAESTSDDDVLTWLRRRAEVRFAQFDCLLEPRSSSVDSLFPDDPLFFQQWSLQNSGAQGGLYNADLDAPQAWAATTGGLTPGADTIVVAVIDGGLQHNHQDLKPNLWKNYGEIPNDGIDNDQNGYTDDYKGWNVWEQNDDIWTWNTTHGTSVAGIIGAKGNNGTGIAGINWNVKIMFVAGSGLLSNVIASYDYVWKARKRYNETEGAEGAFVVAVNNSFGINYGTPDEAPLWCAVFDTLGQQGILSIAATANLSIDVDVEGDLPTTCPSPYLIAVTNLTSYDTLPANAAWGHLSIDLGAYGHNILSTTINNGYATFSGTSYAAPQVSGAVGLLYATDCPDLLALAKADPSAGALAAKAAMLNATVYNPDLSGKVLTDGRLNLATMLGQYESECTSCPAPFDVRISYTEPGAIGFTWKQLPGQTYTTLRWRKSVDSVWFYLTDVTSPFNLTGLDTCTSYVFSLMTVCGSENSTWSYDKLVQTAGCCLPPEAVIITAVTDASVGLSWMPCPASPTFAVRWQVAGTGLWQATTTTNPGIVLNELIPCTGYVIQVGTHCTPDSVEYGPAFTFKTSGCGSCTDADYCPSSAQSSLYEWIASVRLNDWINNSGTSGQGYQDFTDGSAGMPQLPVGMPIELELVPGFWGIPSKVYFKLFVDLNADGDFDEANELLFDPGYSTSSPISATIFLPDSQSPLETRMRVIMKYMTAYDTVPGACEWMDFGQVEDYCVQVGELNTATGNQFRQTNTALHLWPVPSGDRVWFKVPETSLGCTKFELDVRDAFGRVVLRRTVLPEEHNQGLVGLDVAQWLPGWYAVRLFDEHQWFTGELVKQ